MTPMSDTTSKRWPALLREGRQGDVVDDEAALARDGARPGRQLDPLDVEAGLASRLEKVTGRAADVEQASSRGALGDGAQDQLGRQAPRLAVFEVLLVDDIVVALGHPLGKRRAEHVRAGLATHDAKGPGVLRLEGIGKRDLFQMLDVGGPDLFDLGPATDDAGHGRPFLDQVARKCAPSLAGWHRIWARRGTTASRTPMSPKTLIFIPTYDERENVGPMCEQILALGLDADLLFMDDGSPDGTGQLLDGLAAKHARVRVVHRAGKAGIGSAHKAGITLAYDEGYERLVTLDCDFTHRPEMIPQFLDRSGAADAVVGSRYLETGSLPGWTALRKSLTTLGHVAHQEHARDLPGRDRGFPRLQPDDDPARPLRPRSVERLRLLLREHAGAAAKRSGDRRDPDHATGPYATAARR